MQSLKSILFTIVILFFFICNDLVASPKNKSADSDTFHTNNLSRFKVGEGTFLLDDEPFVIKAAELHYPRIPREYWDHRIKMCKALGMNTICLYVFWNVHETAPDIFDFNDQNDISDFIRLCHDNDMKVILRPGPYVCAEWEMGGLPWWLLKKKDIVLRENDPYFLDRVARFEEAVCNEVCDLTIDNGGPIIMIQVENEYGSYGKDKEYIANIRDILRNLYGDNITLFQCDWSSNFLENGLDDLIWTLNFGAGADIDEQFSSLKSIRPSSPLMCSEYWSGWFDKWGAKHETRSADDMVAGIGEMLSKNISFSLYMTHGGTNWGHWAGANSPGYSPDVTSYDYDAPINEQGVPTPKYFLLQNLLKKYSVGNILPEMPDTIPTISIPKFELSEIAVLPNVLSPAISDSTIRNMEEYNQGYGSIQYSTTLPFDISAGDELILKAHDFTQIFIDGKYTGSLDRRNNDTSIYLPDARKGAKLEILVEAMGRINFGRAIKDFKGIIEMPKLIRKGNLNGPDTVRNWSNWEIRLLPDDIKYYEKCQYESLDSIKPDLVGRGPRGIYRGNFNVDEIGDTFLNLELWGKGLVYVNGHALGRFWNIGPQQTLYLPGCWLNPGNNEIVILDILGPEKPEISGLKEPVLDKLQYNNPQPLSIKPDISDYMHIVSEDFRNNESGWRERTFDASVPVQNIVLEIQGVDDISPVVSVAELYLLDEKGQRINREKWKIVWVDSEDKSGGNHGADKIFDLQESTYWQTDSNDKDEHSVIIDLGQRYKIGGIQYLPRVDRNIGRIGKFNIYGK
ncbi:MAG: beta-galactosidase [Muribaculaceae bacterium]|nr:beta-galactosidase [Muribaculaceae bacterium]